MNQQHEIIIEKVSEIFFARGFQKISLDKLASNLKISKKTFYKYYSSKDDIVKDCTFRFLRQNASVIDSIMNTASNPIEKLNALLHHLGSKIAVLDEAWLRDIRDFRPELWKEIDDFRKIKLESTMSTLYEEGRRTQLFREYPEQIVIRLFSVCIRGIISPQFILSSKISPAEALSDAVDLLLTGIMTEKGKQIYNRIVHFRSVK